MHKDHTLEVNSIFVCSRRKFKVIILVVLCIVLAACAFRDTLYEADILRRDTLYEADIIRVETPLPTNGIDTIMSANISYLIQKTLQAGAKETSHHQVALSTDGAIPPNIDSTPDTTRDSSTDTTSTTINTDTIINTTTATTTYTTTTNTTNTLTTSTTTTALAVTPNPWNIYYVDPLLLDVEHRFDIVVKTVYAVHYRRKAMSPMAKKTYLRHLKVWNGFAEGCQNQKGAFDKTLQCSTKSGPKAFMNSFHDTISSIVNQGFNTKVSLIPVSNIGYFPYNGAHRWATAIALGFKSIPVQRLKRRDAKDWGVHFFVKEKGLEQKYVDFAFQQWNLHVKNSSVEDEYWLKFISSSNLTLHAVIVFPSTQLLLQNNVVQILNREVAEGILLQRYIYLNTTAAADMFVQHLYASEAWLGNSLPNGKTKSCFPKGSENIPIWVMVLQTSKDVSAIKTTKENIRKMFKLGKDSIHMTDNAKQTISVARIALSKNTVKMLHEIPWTTASQRKQSGVCKPSASLNHTLVYYLDDTPCAMPGIEQPANVSTSSDTNNESGQRFGEILEKVSQHLEGKGTEDNEEGICRTYK